MIYIQRGKKKIKFKLLSKAIKEVGAYEIITIVDTIKLKETVEINKNGMTLVGKKRWFKPWSKPTIKFVN